MRLNARFDLKTPRGSRRRTARRPLRLTIQGKAGENEEPSEVVVHNLSTTGALLETSIELGVGTEFDIELPEASTVRAKVAWKSGGFVGCQFAAPLSRAVLSAAQLSSHPKHSAESALLSGTPLELGARIREWRQRNGLTVAEFAQKMDVSRPTVWAWESGKSKPRRAKLARLAKQIGPADPPSKVETGDEAVERPGPENDLQNSIATSRMQIAEVVGTSPEKVRIIVEF